MMRRRVGRPGLVGTMARTAVVAGTATAVSGGVARRQQTKAQQAADAQTNQEQEAAPAPAPAPAAAPEQDTITQLKELAALKDQGILTEEEFAAQKAKILGS
jgi:membrane protease subunit (stomatin/prohibitin family)